MAKKWLSVLANLQAVLAAVKALVEWFEREETPEAPEQLKSLSRLVAALPDDLADALSSKEDGGDDDDSFRM